jgi:hypothetical protein
MEYIVFFFFLVGCFSVRDGIDSQRSLCCSLRRLDGSLRTAGGSVRRIGCSQRTPIHSLRMVFVLMRGTWRNLGWTNERNAAGYQETICVYKQTTRLPAAPISGNSIIACTNGGRFVAVITIQPQEANICNRSIYARVVYYSLCSVRLPSTITHIPPSIFHCMLLQHTIC